METLNGKLRGIEGVPEHQLESIDSLDNADKLQTFEHHTKQMEGALLNDSLALVPATSLALGSYDQVTDAK